jgi:GxxExxY protein
MKTLFQMGFRADPRVQDSVIAEIKSITKIAATHRKQLITYLRRADKRLDLSINVNVAPIKDGLARIGLAE